MAKGPTDEYSKKEAQQRFEAALKGALKAPHKPRKAKAVIRKKPVNKLQK